MQIIYSKSPIEAAIALPKELYLLIAFFATDGKIDTVLVSLRSPFSLGLPTFLFGFDMFLSFRKNNLFYLSNKFFYSEMIL